MSLDEKKKILIIGGTGFLGYHVAKKLLDRPYEYEIVSVSLNKPKNKRYIKKVKYIHFDISKKKNFHKLDKYNFDYIINLGGYVNHLIKNQIKDNHYNAVKNLYEYFKKKKIKTFIQIGSSLEYGKALLPHKEKYKCKPEGHYGKYKLKATSFLLKKNKKEKFPVCILRFYQVYGPAQDKNRFIPQVINACIYDKTILLSHCKQKRDFMHVDDATKAIIMCLDNKLSIGKIINIGSGKSLTLLNILNHIKTKFNTGKFLLGKVKQRNDELTNIYPSLHNAKKILNWKSNISIINGLNKTILYYKKISKKNK